MPLPEPFDYRVEDEAPLAVGDQVAAPLGPRLMRGVVTAVREARGVNRPLKPIAGRLDDAPLPQNTLAFIDWAARYACQSPGEALAMTLRGLRSPPPKPERRLIATGAEPARATPARTRVLQALQAHGLAMRPGELAAAAAVSSGVVKGLLDEGVLEVVDIPAPPPFGVPDPSRPSAALNPSQSAAAEALRRQIDRQAFNVALLDGVTGSGKTEVYLEAVAATLSQDPEAQVLVLLPEIALTQAVIRRFEQRFAALPAEWHSAVPPPKRRQVWDAVADGACRIVVGARSALFLPFKHLRLIVVDEEHDGSFKQEDGFVYHARDLSVARATARSRA